MEPFGVLVSFFPVLETLLIGILALAVGLAVGWVAHNKLGLRGGWASAGLTLGAILVFLAARAVVT